MGLIKKIVELWAETNWIRTINKEQRKFERLQDATNRQRYVVEKLTTEFLKRYPPPKGD